MGGSSEGEWVGCAVVVVVLLLGREGKMVGGVSVSVMGRRSESKKSRSRLTSRSRVVRSDFSCPLESRGTLQLSSIVESRSVKGTHRGQARSAQFKAGWDSPEIELSMQNRVRA